MDNFQFKKEVIDKAIQKQQSIIDDFRTRIDDIKESEADRETDQYELDRQSLDAESNTHINHLADQLNFAVEQLNLLNRIKVEKPLHEEVSFGSVVLTDKKNFFVSASLEDFKVNGEELFGLSVQAPIYKKMKGKTTGDHFSWNDTDFEIKSLM